ncbi:MAG: hypothetical protein JXR34_13470, partial [Bacteroidales bacterium]|nr:hypothetical protein [Bacteroidales bacterium]
FIMKHNINILVIFSVILLIVSQSCNKEEEDRPSSNTGFKYYSSLENPEDEINLFLENLNNPENVSPISIDDMVWSIEAGLNYLYSDFEKLDYQNITKGQVFSDFEQNDGGLIEFLEVENVYNQLKNSLSSAYAEIMTDEKWLILVDITHLEGDTLTMTYYFASVKSSLPTTFTFGTTDYWYYGEELGKCGLYAGQGIGSDAADQLDLYIRGFRMVNSNQPPGTRSIPTNVQYPFPIIAGQSGPSPINPINPNDVTPQDNQYDYLLAHGYNGWPNYHYCFDPNEMNFYYGGAWTLIYMQNTNYPNKELIYTNIDVGKIGTNVNPTQYSHGLTTYYGDVFYTVNTQTSNL